MVVFERPLTSLNALPLKYGPEPSNFVALSARKASPNMNIFCEHEIPENHFALVLLPGTDVACVVKFTRHWAAEIGMLASRALDVVPETALPPSTVALLPENEIATSGDAPRVAPRPLLGCARAAFDDEPIFFSVFDDGGPAAAARLEPLRTNAIVNPASAAPRRRENALTTTSCVFGLLAAAGSYWTCTGATAMYAGARVSLRYASARSMPMSTELTGGLAALRTAVSELEQTGSADALDAAFAAAGEAVRQARGARANEPADATEARTLLGRLPDLDQFATVAVSAAGDATDAAAARLWDALGLSSRPPRWDADERSGARILIACACAPYERRGPAWLVPRLLRLAAPRWAALLAQDLSGSDESHWEHALGARYASVRQRYAPRTKRRTGGVAEVVASDERTLEALRIRLARWLAVGPDPATIAEEIEAAIVSTRTPARLA